MKKIGILIFFGTLSFTDLTHAQQSILTRKISSIRNLKVPFDYDGDGKSDFGIYRNGQFWYLASGSNQELRSIGFADPYDIPVSPDFDGDGKTDIAIYRRQSRQNWWLDSSTQILRSWTFGNHGDTPIYADFDGDGKTDLGASYIPDAKSFWYYSSSSLSLHSIFVGEIGDIPVTGDFEGKGRDFAGVYSPSQGNFVYINSVGAAITINHGIKGGIPLTGDFDGDGIVDVGVYRPSDSSFFIKLSKSKSLQKIKLGEPGDTPIIGDYDGDGLSDIAVFKIASGRVNVYSYRLSSTGAIGHQDMGDYHDEPLGKIAFEYAKEKSWNHFNNLLADAPQIIYQNGVPHTDKNGKLRRTLQSDSYFPRCGYTPAPWKFQEIAEAGFNCLTTWGHMPLKDYIAKVKPFNLQIINQLHVPHCNYSKDPHCNADTFGSSYIQKNISDIQSNSHDLSSVLGYYAEEEATACVEYDKYNKAPPGKLNSCEERLQNFHRFHAALKKVDPIRPFFNLDIALPYEEARSVWTQWGTSGDIISQDSYPFNSGKEQSVASFMDRYKDLLNLSNEDRPSWFTVQVFEQPTWNENWHWTMPTPEQMRVQVFGGLVHGATGIIYFTLDNFISRDGRVVGISPNGTEVNNNRNAPHQIIANPQQIAASEKLWQATVEMNSELQRLQNVIFSPTSTLDYKVSIQGNGITKTPLRTILKKDAHGVYTLFVVNMDKKPLPFNISLGKKPMNLKRINSKGSRIPKESFENDFSDHIEEFGVRIFEFQ